MSEALLQRNAPVTAAKELFWRNGYDETSIEALVGATGHNRYALYTKFGGKLELFLAALAEYFEERRSLFFSVLMDPARGPFDAIETVSEFCIREMAEREAGCLMFNVALDVGHDTPIVRDRVNEYLSNMRKAKEMALAAADQRGELNPAITPADGAALLVCQVMGIGQMARHGAALDEMLHVMRSGLDVLRSGYSEGAAK